MAKQVVIKVEDLTKTFKIPTETSNGIKQKIINLLKGKKGYREFTPLKDISFEVEEGDFFGIVGRNGSGKSTLLKSIANIYTPTKGAVHVSGTLVPFIELGVGFNPELTGRENVFLNGALLGFSRKEMVAMYDDIVSFAEIEDFMDEKLKNYSSGMQVRLAFSIAIKAEGDILLLDEVLAVGDEAFQRKCEDYFAEMKKRKKTIVLVTHSMDSVRKYCNKAMMIRNGEIVAYGSPDDVANEYSLENLSVPTKLNDTESNDTQQDSIIKNIKVELLSPKQINQDNKVKIRYTVNSSEDIEAAIVMDLYNMDDNYYLYCFGSPRKQLKAGSSTTFEVVFDISQFNNMNVVVHSSLRSKNDNLLAFSSEAESPHFMIRRNDYPENKPQAGVIFKDGNNAKWQ